MLTTIALVLVVISAFLALSFWPVTVSFTTELPRDLGDEGFSHRSFEELLERFVDEKGGVDYEEWQTDASARRKLELYLGAVAAFSPDSHPERFEGKSEKVAYWIYAYNALVIGEVLKRYPLSSVTDVKAPLEVVRGLGFFYNLKFSCGGERLSLYEIEHKKVLKLAQDPRVHFVLNCASGSCPTIRPQLPTGPELETQLAAAAAEFVEDDKNVDVDHASRTVRLSKIFKWYEEDFLDSLAQAGHSRSSGVLAYLPLVASADFKEELQGISDYEIVWLQYDWSLNKSEGLEE